MGRVEDYLKKTLFGRIEPKKKKKEKDISSNVGSVRYGPEPLPEPAPPAPKKKVTENPKGLPVITTRTGDEILLTKEEQQAREAEAETNRFRQARGEVPLAMAREQEQLRQRNQQLMSLQKELQLTPEQIQKLGDADLDLGQALGAGAASAVPGIAGGVVGGAVVAGASAGAIGGPVGAIGGAVLGGAAAFIGGAISNIRGQTSGEFSADQSVLTKGERTLRMLITDTNANPGNAPENIELFYKTLNAIDIAHAKTYSDSQESINRFLGKDGTPQLAKFNVFNDHQRVLLTQQFEEAVMYPDPNKNLLSSEELAGLMTEGLNG